MTTTTQLTWDVLVSPLELTVVDGGQAGPSVPGFADLPPNAQYETWSPTSSTLITGQRDAVLVDPLMTKTQARVLANWIAATGKNLTTVYVTHGHGDHHFGLGEILDRFPGARAVAAPAVVEHMRQMVDLEGHEFVVVDLGHTDTDNTTCLHIPDLDVVVAGDAAYNDVHLYLAESDSDRRQAWIGAIDSIEALGPVAVIAGHKRTGRADHPKILEETRQYIRDFDRVDAVTATARELYDQMLALYPDRVNPGVLWISARAVKP